MVSPLPAYSAHIEKLTSSSERMAYALVGHQGHRSDSGPINNRRNLVLFASLGNHFRRLFAGLGDTMCEYFILNQREYNEVNLSPTSLQRLEAVGRKTIVLDLDETLVHSCYTDPETQETVGCSQVPQQAVPDYTINVSIDGVSAIPFRVFKRPHVDKFLSLVSKWYDVVIYTASLEVYAGQVLDLLDKNRGLLKRRLYRQHCRSLLSLFTKDLTLVSTDLSSVFIIDNSPNAYLDFPENAIPIKSYLYDPDDTELLKLLPFLDALRFTRDVRSVLSRRIMV